MTEQPSLDAGVVTTLIEKIVDDITDSEIDTLISFFRKERETVLAAEAKGTRAKKTNLDKAATETLVKNITTSELELD